VEVPPTPRPRRRARAARQRPLQLRLVTQHQPASRHQPRVRPAVRAPATHPVSPHRTRTGQFPRPVRVLPTTATQVGLHHRPARHHRWQIRHLRLGLVPWSDRPQPHLQLRPVPDHRQDPGHRHPERLLLLPVPTSPPTRRHRRQPRGQSRRPSNVLCHLRLGERSCERYIADPVPTTAASWDAPGL
jgi:hypothetical protein